MTTSSRPDWLHSAPAVIAISLGSIYALGAISIYGQIKGAGLNAVQTMPLVPLDQVLGRGIGSITSAFSQIAVMSILMGLVVVAILIPGASESQTTGVMGNRVKLALIGVIALLFAVAGPLNEVAILVIAVSAMVGTWFLVAHRFGAHSRTRLIAEMYATGGAAFLLTWTVSAALLAPNPLPDVTLTLVSDQAVSGGLVANTDGTWYVALSNDSIVSIPSRRVARSHIDYPQRKSHRSSLDMILGRPPSTILGERLNKDDD